MKLVPLLGRLLFGLIMVNLIFHFDKYLIDEKLGVPRSQLAADGLHFRDGTEINEVTLAEFKIENERQDRLATACGVTAAFCYVGYLLFTLYRLRKSPIMRAAISELRGNRDQAHSDEVQLVQDYFEQVRGTARPK